MNASIDALARKTTLSDLETQTFDVVIVGGGISGAGVANAATRAGLSVALLEGDDFAAGTSSRSSKLIHGGLRYMLTGDLALVRKTALERKIINRLAPHLAQPRRMVLPARGRVRMMQYRAGIGLYEKFGNVEESELHERWGHEEMAKHEPLLRRDQFKFAMAYTEYSTDDARLVLGNLRQAVKQGAIAANRARVTGLLHDGSGRDRTVRGVEARCGLTGREFRVRGKTVVNAAGPWLEDLQKMETTGIKPMLALSKGIHVVLSFERLPIKNIVVFESHDGRHLFLVRRGPVVYVGTTDTFHDRGAQMWPEMTEQDVDYLLEAIPQTVDTKPLQHNDVLGAWAGLRAMVAQVGKKSSEVSRNDQIVVGDGGMISIAGGKLTGYRSVARSVLNKLADVGGFTLAEGEDAPLPGGDFSGGARALAARLAQETQVDERVARRLTSLYGTEARQVLDYGATPVAPGSKVLLGEVDWAVRHEGAATFEDLVYRRTRIGIFDPQVRHILPALAQRMAQVCDWDAAQCTEQLTSVRRRLAADLSFAPSPEPAPAAAAAAAVHV